MAEIYCEAKCALYQRGLVTKNMEGKCKFNGQKTYPGSTPCPAPEGPQTNTRISKKSFFAATTDDSQRPL